MATNCVVSHGPKPVFGMVLAGLLLAGCQTPPKPFYAGNAVEGRKVAEELCASCHAVDPGRMSPNSAAPPFSQVLESYGANALSEDLDQAVPISHLRMPTFYLGEGHAEDLVAYLKSITSQGGSQ
jgi:mono/diheme cytochrome c family protein